MNVNFNTNNLVISVYPRFAGGKFLINCLGLSNDAVFQDARLADRQLAGDFDHISKIDYIMNALDEHHIDNSRLWNDLKLGCVQLFGSSEDNYTAEGKETTEWERPYVEATRPVTINQLTINFTETAQRLSYGSHKFFIGTHSASKLKNILSVWKNPKLIVFTNTVNFRRLRAGEYYAEHEKLDSITNWDNQTSTFLKEKELDVYYVDNNIYFSEDRTINEIQKIYAWLNLSEFDEDAISTYYRRWIKTCLPNNLIHLRNS